jgi:hypothetical protein
MGDNNLSQDLYLVVYLLNRVKEFIGEFNDFGNINDNKRKQNIWNQFYFVI